MALAAHDQVRSLLDEIRDICAAHGVKTRRLSEASDCIETISRAYMEPDKAFDWMPYGLTATQCRIMDLLRSKSHKTFTKENIFNALYFDRSPCDLPDIKIVDVFICKLRDRLEASDCPYGIATEWGVGYRLVKRGMPQAVANALAELEAA